MDFGRNVSFTSFLYLPLAVWLSLLATGVCSLPHLLIPREDEGQEWPIPVVLPLNDVYGMTLSFHIRVVFLPAHTVHLLGRLHLAVYVRFTAYAKSKVGSE